MNDIFGTSYSQEQASPIWTKTRREKQSHYRAHIASICYPEISQELIKTGPYDMPIIRPNNVIPTISDTTPFDRIKCKSSSRDSIVIFYINDDRFANRLTHPWDYTAVLRQYDGVIAPDLSMYIDMDYPERLSNNYWNKVLTAYWQNRDVNIYPNVSWSLPDSYEYCAAGLPRRSVIAINSMGILKENFSKSIWLDGYKYMLDVLEPTCILRYGPKIFGEDEDRSIYLENKQLNLLRHGGKR